MSEVKRYLSNFIDEIKLLIDNKTKKLDYDKTYRGIIKNINNDICTVEINKELFECKIRNDLQININDIVLVKSINNNFSDKYVDAKLGVVGDGISEGVDWANVLNKPTEYPPSIHTQDASTIEGLSTVAVSGNYNDLTNQPIIPDVSTKADLIYVDTELGKKVDKIVGKQLSTEDYSTTEKQKLANIENNANNYTHPSTHSADIIVDGVTNKVFTAIEKAKLGGISENANKVETSATNGSIRIDGVDKVVYTHPSGTNPHGTTKADINLGNVENKSSATIRSEITSSNVTTALGYIPENISKKGIANGYAGLDSNAKIPLSLLPDISMNKSYVVNTIADRDALTEINTADRVYVLDAGDGSREGFIWDGTQWLKDSDTDWANVSLEWININGKPISLPADIDDSVNKKHTHANKTIIDTVTQTLIDNWNNAFTHISDTIKHISSAERTKWNAVDNKVDKIAGKGLSTEDYSTTEKQKLAGIEMGANKYTLPVATDNILGGIKVGDNLSITQDGVLSASSNPDNYIIKEEEFITSSNQTVFTLTSGSYTPNKNMIDVYVYGQKQPKNLFMESNSTTITSKLPFDEGIRVIIKYIQGINATPYPVHGNMHLTGGDDAIPLATTSQDGLMSKDDKSKVHSHSNKTLLDTYTQTETNLADAVTKKHSHSGNDTGHYHNTDRDRANHTGTQTSSTISDFATTVRSTVLTGLTITTNAVISATDSVLSALGKLQKQISDNLSTLTNHIANKSNPHMVDKSQVGLSNVDNTSDLDKPISNAIQTALNNKVDNSRVLTDVPANAKFTDTITTINGKTGAISKEDIVALGIPAQDTVYTHPANHPASVITQDSNNRFVTDAEKANFHAHSNKSALDLVSGTNTGNETTTSIGNLINGATVKNTPIDADMIGLMDSGASNILKKLSWSNIKTTLKTYFDTLYSAIGHNHTLAGLSEKSYNSLTDKPASLPANGGNADTAKHLVGDDTRSINSPPSEYMFGGSRYIGKASWQTEFKNISTLGLASFLSGLYCFLETKTPWDDASGGYPIQIAYGNGNPVWRVGISASTWSAWSSLGGTKIITSATQPTGLSNGDIWIQTI